MSDPMNFTLEIQSKFIGFFVLDNHWRQVTGPPQFFYFQKQRISIFGEREAAESRGCIRSSLVYVLGFYRTEKEL